MICIWMTGGAGPLVWVRPGWNRASGVEDSPCGSDRQGVGPVGLRTGPVVLGGSGVEDNCDSDRQGGQKASA